MDLLQLLIQLLLDTSYSWIRMLIALFLSILLSLAIGIYMARSKKAEQVLIPVIDIFQTLPILAFFPVVLYVIVTPIPGAVGINIAVILLIITSMLWNMIFGVYEAIKTLPQELVDVASLYKLSLWEKLRKVFIPASMPRLVEQSVLSWSIGLFYLVTSEIFSTGNFICPGTQSSTCSVPGIGTALTNLALSNSTTGYFIGIIIFILFVIATRFLLFKPLQDYAERYSKDTVPKAHVRVNPLTRMLHVHNLRLIHFGTGKQKLKRYKLQVPVETVKNIVPNKKAEIAYALAIILIATALIIVLLNANIIGDELQIVTALLYSFARVWVAFFAVLIITVPLSIYLVFISKQETKYLLLFQVLASIPATILLPLIVVLFNGSPYQGELIAFTVFFLSGIWYIVFSIVASTRTIQSEVFEVKKIFGVKGWGAWKNIYLKAIAPGLITGAITAIAAEWNASIVAEYFPTSAVLNPGVSIGIGKQLDLYLAQGHIGLLLLALINLVVMILLIDKFLWKRLYKRIEAVYR